MSGSSRTSRCSARQNPATSGTFEQWHDTCFLIRCGRALPVTLTSVRRFITSGNRRQGIVVKVLITVNVIAVAIMAIALCMAPSAVTPAGVHELHAEPSAPFATADPVATPPSPNAEDEEVAP